MKKSERFGMLLSSSERAALDSLADRERISAAAVVRRLIWRRAQELGLATEESRTAGISAPPEAKNGSD